MNIDDIEISQEELEAFNDAMNIDSSKNDENSSDLVEGVIVSINEEDNQAIIDIGRKNEAIISLDQLRDSEGNFTFKEGDKLDVVITGYRGERPVVSYDLAQKRAAMKEFIEEYDESQEYIVEGVVTKKNKGGFILDCDGLEFFMPRTLSYISNKTNPIGKKVKALIVKVDKESGSVVVSRKELIEREKGKVEEIVKSLSEATEPVTGIVKKITSYGMFVDVGGIDGLVHYSEISHKGPVNPAKYYSEGDEVAVKMIDYDKKKRHLSLSIKAAVSNPWDNIDDIIEVGDTIAVTVSNIEPYGVFVDLGEDLEAFLHVSEISWDKNVKHPKDYLNVGDEINVEIIEIDKENQRLRVSLKKLLPKPIDAFRSEYSIGNVVKGKVVSLTDFGAFVKVGEIEGLLHNQECSWDKGVKCKDILNVGDEVEVEIIDIDAANSKVSLSKKVLEESPAQKFASTHKVGDIVEGTVKDMKDFGIFITIDNGVDALIRSEDLYPLKAEEIEKGQTIQAVLVFIDAKKDRIRASVKRLEKQKERDALSEYSDDSSINSLGDLIKK